MGVPLALSKGSCLVNRKGAEGGLFGLPDPGPLALTLGVWGLGCNRLCVWGLGCNMVCVNLYWYM